MKATPRYIDLQKRISVGPPVFAAISAVSVKGRVVLATSDPSRSRWLSASPIDRDVLLSPEVLVEEELAGSASDGAGQRHEVEFMAGGIAHILTP